MPYSDEIKARFWARAGVCKHGEACQDCCWLWIGGKFNTGYWRFYLWLKEKKLLSAPAHRVAWEIAHDEFISNNLCSLHTCDNPPCVNPHHLFVGTHQDNIDDTWRKGRGHQPLLEGEFHER